MTRSSGRRAERFSSGGGITFLPSNEKIGINFKIRALFHGCGVLKKKIHLLVQACAWWW